MASLLENAQILRAEAVHHDRIELNDGANRCTELPGNCSAVQQHHLGVGGELVDPEFQFTVLRLFTNAGRVIGAATTCDNAVEEYPCLDPNNRV